MNNTFDLTSNITNARNRVFTGGLGIGKNNPISLHTNSNSIYRVTGMDQLEDIINCGYVRPKDGKLKGGHKGEVFWTKGSEKIFYYDKRPVLETSIDKLQNDQIGALSINDLTAVWLFNEEKQCYENNITNVLQMRNKVIETGMSVSVSAEYKESIEKINEQRKNEFDEARSATNEQRQELRQQQLSSILKDEIHSGGLGR